MNVLTLTTPDVENGLGCRVTLWFAGCGHHCEHCHNKHTWNYNQGKNILGKEVIEKIFNECSKNEIKGITLSGGDPLFQSETDLNELIEFLKSYKEKFSKHDIWIYSGFYLEELTEKQMDAVKLCDYFVDGRFEKDKYDPDLKFRGSSNQTIWEIKDGEFIKSELND